MLGLAEIVPWYLNPVFLPAASGLLGVIVGALVTGVFTYVLDEKRDERERAREACQQALELKRAARMIDAEFSNACACARVAVQNDHYWSSDQVPLGLSNWDKYGATIAPALSGDAWLKVLLAVDAIRNINAYREMDAEGAPSSFMPAVSQTLKKGLTSCEKTISEAMYALNDLVV